MSVRITTDRVALYDSVSEFAFGPTFETEAEALDFLDWWERQPASIDLRRVTDRTLKRRHARWERERLEHELND